MAYQFFGSQSSVTLQDVVDDMQTFADVEPIILAAGFTNKVAFNIANLLMQEMTTMGMPQKWNSFEIPPFYSNSFQQDYAVVNPAGATGSLTLTSVSTVSASQGTASYNGTITDGAFGAYVGVPFVITGFSNSGNNGTFMCVASSASALILKNTGAVIETHAGAAISAAGPLIGMSYLERGVAFDINNSSQPKPWVRIECGRAQGRVTASYTGAAGLGDPGFRCNWIPNRSLYYGTWGSANTGNATLGNNPLSGSVYTNPLGAGSQPFNPITQIKDANGNFLLLTTYGTEGNAAPLAAVDAVPGTTVAGSGATTVWTVLDPNGWGFRMVPAPSQTGTQWQFNLTAQMKPTRFVSLAQTLSPLTDQFETFFREGFLAQLYRRSPERAVYAKFAPEWAKWQEVLKKFVMNQDRELEEFKFIPSRTVFGAARSRNNFQGGAWPFNYPRP
jgi:hypothetical protein